LRADALDLYLRPQRPRDVNVRVGGLVTQADEFRLQPVDRQVRFAVALDADPGLRGLLRDLDQPFLQAADVPRGVPR
jgi:hypothetical protein